MCAENIQASPGRRTYRISELLGGLTALFEDRVGRVWVVGEIANLHRAQSGHSYFTLKDESGQIRAALFRSAASRIPFSLEDGLEVMAYADVSIYAPRGELQLVVHKLEPRGQGALQLAFEQLRQRLEAEGLFEPSRKRDLPELPSGIAVVTSSKGAAVRDVIQVSDQVCPSIPLLIVPTRVQGTGSEREIAAALELAAQQPGIEVILLVRGGGSLEDLWAFNSEEVARAIARCGVPVVSGVGHETDFTIADFVADLRAPTPSAAVIQALPDVRVLRSDLSRVLQRARLAIADLLQEYTRRLQGQRHLLAQHSPLARVSFQHRRLDAARVALQREIVRHLERHKVAFSQAAARLEMLSPLAVLGRGYALAIKEDSGAIVRGPEDVSVGERLSVRLARGRLRTRVEAIEDAEG